MKTKKKHSALTAALVFSAIVLPITGTQAEVSLKLKEAAQRQVMLGIQAAPKTSGTAGVLLSSKVLSGPNPFLSQVVDPTKVDYHGWRVAIESQALVAQKARNAAQGNLKAHAPQPLLVDEREPDELSGLNDSISSGELINGFSVDTNPRARILGTLAPPRSVSTNFSTFAEDDGAIPLANQSGVAASFGAMQTNGIIGDGPHGSGGSGTGDFDFYSVDLSSGQSMTVDTDITLLDTLLFVFDTTGTVVAANDDDGETLASRLTYTPTEAGTFYVMVSGFGSGTVLPENPFDSASGFGAGSEGKYKLLITTAESDIDVYAIDLMAGDVIGATIKGAGNRLQVFESSGTEVIGSSQDLSALYPVASPLPGGGNAVVAYTASVNSRYFITVSGNTEGNYDALLEVYRAGLENEPLGSVQKILLDFDGARVQTRVFGGPGQRDLTGLAGFLGGWGFGPDDEEELINATVKVVKENLRRDLKKRGLNQAFKVKIVDSRKHRRRNEFGTRLVSRVVIGGTIQESGISTIGIASSIDPGNFGHEDDALVLLDLLSAPAPNLLSINTFLAASAEDRIKLVAIGLGNIISHEVGHYLGNYHTDQFNASANLMDQGGNLPNLLGTGDDLLLGTNDDIDVDFGLDEFVPNEGITGIEDTLNNTA
ncbi:MAG: hypothetical protein GXP19_09825, partial [Gammaproteobacteria bacterium]|nr:hypothetical protein [Gammaproteobacteria bacterium]